MYTYVYVIMYVCVCIYRSLSLSLYIYIYIHINICIRAGASRHHTRTLARRTFRQSPCRLHDTFLNAACFSAAAGMRTTAE